MVNTIFICFLVWVPVWFMQGHAGTPSSTSRQASQNCESSDQDELFFILSLCTCKPCTIITHSAPGLPPLGSLFSHFMFVSRTQGSSRTFFVTVMSIPPVLRKKKTYPILFPFPMGAIFINKTPGPRVNCFGGSWNFLLRHDTHSLLDVLALLLGCRLQPCH